MVTAPQVKVGDRIRFLLDIVEPADGDHPTFQLAERGGLGTVQRILDAGWYLVFWDGWTTAPFKAQAGEFEVLAEGEA